MSWLLLISLVTLQEQSLNPGSVATGTAAPVLAASAKDDPHDAWVQEARDWLVACRVANDRLNAEQIKVLTERMNQLSPAALRVLTTVYEQTYGVVSPLSAADRRPPDATEAEREWIMAYRILYDRLTPEEAKKYAQTLEAMTPNQIQALVLVYEEKNRQQRERAQVGGGTSSSPSQEPSEAQRNLEVARQQMEFERQRRSMALGRAGAARAQTNQALVSANTSANRAAAAENARLLRMEQFTNAQSLQHNAFQNRMYERSSTPNPYQNNWFRLY